MPRRLKSIMQDEEECFICGRKGFLHVHHCLFGNKRSLADQDGLWVYLCPSCHEIGKNAVHGSSAEGIRRKKQLQIYAQHCWEKYYGTREEFIERYGQSYIEEE